jgi:putative SOS response-associated peptidase YedK
MCGRFALYADYEDLLARFDIGEAALDKSSYEANYNVAPSQQIAAFINVG